MHSEFLKDFEIMTRTNREEYIILYACQEFRVCSGRCNSLSPLRFQVGWDVVCRIGDPTDPHSLLRAGAHKATCILSMMSAEDKKEEENTDKVAEAPWSVAEWAVALICDNPRATVLVLLLSDTLLRLLGFQTP